MSKWKLSRRPETTEVEITDERYARLLDEVATVLVEQYRQLASRRSSAESLDPNFRKKRV
ncbi:MAG: hypothetical protein ACXWPM_08210 [Bdellovibrionota bacterium]